MKILLVISAICIASSMGNPTQAQTNKLFDATTVGHCQHDIGLTAKEIEDGIRDAFNGANEKQKCFALCALEAKGAVNTNGIIVHPGFDNALNTIGFNYIEKKGINSACLSQIGNYACDRGAHLIICIYNNV